MAISFSEGFAHIIDGKKVDSPTTRAILNPSTEETIAHVPVATREQLEEAVVAAERAFPAWSSTPWEQRQKALTDIAALLDEHAAGFQEMLMREVGKDRASAAFELQIASPWLRAVAKEKLEDEVLFDDDTKLAKVRLRPFGVCAGITPFNYPIVLTITKMSQALLAGNCIIIKAPPTCPCVVTKYIELCQAVVPPGVLSVLCGGDDLGEWIVRHPRIMRVSMTGSTNTGKAVLRAAADELKSITLELGGNDPAIVLDDADPKAIAQTVMVGATHTAGQICFTMKRIFVHEKIYDRVRDELVKLAGSVKIGDPFDPDVNIGPVHNRRQQEWLRGMIDDCKAKGYKIAFESPQEKMPANGRGYFIPLTIIDNPPDESRIASQEQFGPIIPLLKWSDDDEIVRRTNAGVYGFSVSLWGNDKQRLERIAEKLYYGMVWINKWGAVGGEFPLLGTKHSGVGVESSTHGLRAWTYPQSWVCSK